jgi:hypothetical protein
MIAIKIVSENKMSEKAEMEDTEQLSYISNKYFSIKLEERARAGSREAFNELFYQHRAKAYGWAQQVMHDS